VYYHSTTRGQRLIGVEQIVLPGAMAVAEIYLAITGACLPTMIPVYHKIRYGDAFWSINKHSVTERSIKMRRTKEQTSETVLNPPIIDRDNIDKDSECLTDRLHGRRGVWAVDLDTEAGGRHRQLHDV
jgi:hypothetical protein